MIYLASNYFVAQSTDNRLTNIKNSDFPVFEIVNETSIAITAIKLNLSTAVDTGEQDAMTAADTLYQNIINDLRRIPVLAPSLDSKVRNIIADLESYFSASNIVAKGLLNDNIDSDTLFILVPKIDAHFSALEKGLAQLRLQVKDSFSKSLQLVRDDNRRSWERGSYLSLAIIFSLLTVSYYITRAFTKGLSHAVHVADKIAEGNWDTAIKITSNDETGHLLAAISTMRDKLKHRAEEDHRSEQLQSRVAELNERMRGDQSMNELCRNILDYLTPTTNCQVGALYLFNNTAQELELVSSYAFSQRKGIQNSFRLGESLVGQVGLEKKQICISELPEDYLPIDSGLGGSRPNNILLTPVIHEAELCAVIELASLYPIDEQSMLLLNSTIDAVGIAIHSAQSRIQLSSMLDQTQEQAKSMEQQQLALQEVNNNLEEQARALKNSELKLQSQQEELRASNEELEEQAQALRASEENMLGQQEELRATNEELGVQTKVLESQKLDMELQNATLEKAQNILKEKSEALEVSSKYKSEFLSTMSHELRTPLNSILILSKNLAANKKVNLNDKQIEHCEVIHSAGIDLLTLINDILDLSKVEEGKLQLVFEDIQTDIIRRNIQLNFDHVAKEKSLEFMVSVEAGLPELIRTDRQRLEQILKNLLSNAFKFTTSGGVYMDITRPTADMLTNDSGMNAVNSIAFTVRDTGIGIPKEKQALIFEAFQQADGTTSRKYGGTGLGLTISRELSKLLQGELSLSSNTDKQGSAFTLLLPELANVKNMEFISADESPDKENHTEQTAPSRDTSPRAMTDKRPGLAAVPQKERTVLIIEDDPLFAKLINDVAAEHHIKAHSCHDGESGLDYALSHQPSAIILDVGLPGVNGFSVMEQLKNDDRTRNIPVHFISGSEFEGQAMDMGAFSFLKKPVSIDAISASFDKIESALKTNISQLLIIEDNPVSSEEIKETFCDKGINIISVSTGREGMEVLKKNNIDCIILDLDLPDTDGLSFLQKIHHDKTGETVPVIIYTARDLLRDEEIQLRKYASKVILKTDQSSSRLLNEASLFLNWVDEQASHQMKAPAIEPVHHRENLFKGKKLLIVDDDMRNIYSVSALLEEMDVDIEIAMNGKEAIEALDKSPDKDLVLMDIMMPEMDGYEAMQHIRRDPRFAKLPIIALTAKAMKDDRQKSIDAGANDYISKPLDTDKLISLISVLLRQS